MSADFYAFLNTLEDRMIVCALIASAGNVSHAADALGCGRSTLQAKIKSRGIDPNRYRRAEFSEPKNTPRLDRGWTSHKAMLILSTLESHGWNRTRAAAELGISLRSLRYTIAAMRAKGVEIPESTSTGGRGK